MMMGFAASCGTAFAQTPDMARAIAEDLRWDSEARTSMLDQNAAFAPKVSGFELARYNVNYRKDSSLDSNGNKFTTGGQLAYTKLRIDGNVYSDVYGYGFQYKFSESTGNAVLDDAYGTMKLEDQ